MGGRRPVRQAAGQRRRVQLRRHQRIRAAILHGQRGQRQGRATRPLIDDGHQVSNWAPKTEHSTPFEPRRTPALVLTSAI